MAEDSGSSNGISAEHDRRRQVVDGRPPKTISSLLLLLVAIVILPILAFSVVLLQNSTRAQTEVVNTLAEAATNSIAESVEREITGMLTTLRVLSTAPSLRDGRIAEFYSWSRTSLANSGAHLILLDPELNQIFNTRVPLGQPLGKTSDPASTQLAIELKRPVVSDIFFGRTAQSWVFNVTVPLQEEDGPSRALILTQNAANLERTLQERPNAGGWNTALVDRKGTVVATTEAKMPVGEAFFLSLDLPNRSGLEHIWLNRGDKPYEVILSPSPSSGWWVVSWISGREAARPMRQSLFLLLVGGSIVVVLAIAIATLLARQIAQSVRGLAIDARRLGAGEAVEAREYPVAEVSVVAQALADASQERQNAENEIRFLMREVAHRSKNQLTVVSSIAKQTGRNARTFADFQESFQKRIQGLARSTDLLIAGGIGGVEMRDLVSAQLEPFKPDSASRLEIDGPAFRLSHHPAQTLGMALHELATNAAKYGAYAGASGKVMVAWKISEGRLTLNWREKLRSVRKRPERRGFGTEVIERLVGRALEAEIERTLHADGIEWRFVIPTDKLEQAPAEPADATENNSLAS